MILKKFIISNSNSKTMHYSMEYDSDYMDTVKEEEDCTIEKRKILVEVASGQVLTIEGAFVPVSVYDLTQLKRYVSLDNPEPVDEPVFSFQEFIPRFAELGLQNPTKPKFPIFQDYVDLSFRRKLTMKEFLARYPNEKKRYAALTALGIFYEKFNDDFLLEQLLDLAYAYLKVCKHNVNLRRENYSDMVYVEDYAYCWINSF